MDSISLPVVAPSFERLKRSGSGLHIAAGLLILTHAISHFRNEHSHPLYFWCLLIISLDIFLLVLAGKDILRQLPRVNLFFRLVEIVFFLCIGILMLLQGHLLISIIHIALSIGYSYLFYCEKSFRAEELLSFHHTGITIPSLPDSRFILWTHVNDVETYYDSIHISTSDQEQLKFDLRNNLEFSQLEHIKQFLHFYLGKA
ncbi:MAG: hypothetical protein JST68_28825 [Bacteroidetes bacterium]|nr:hypothetical protein [Bacteroidota bacterium]